jgi:hypothetical protein
MPFGNKRHHAWRQVLLVRNLGHPPSCALHDRKPLLDLVHPGTMHRRNMQHKAPVCGQPGLDLLALVHPYIVKPHVNGRDRRGHLALHMFPQDDAFHRPLARRCGGVDSTRARSQPGQPVQRSRAGLRVFHPHGSAGLGCPGWRFAGPWVQTGVLVDAQAHFPRPQRTGIPGGNRPDLSRECRLTGDRRGQPQMVAPWLQLRMGQNPLDRVGRDRLHHAGADQLPGQCRAIPWRQGPPDRVRALTGQLHAIQGDFRGQKPAGGPVVLGRLDRQCQRRASAAPTCGHAVRATRPVWRWRPTSAPRLTTGWPVPVSPGLQACSGAGALPTRWCGPAPRSRYVALMCVPAWRPPGWCRAGVMTKQPPSVPCFTPVPWGLVLRLCQEISRTQRTHHEPLKGLFEHLVEHFRARCFPTLTFHSTRNGRSGYYDLPPSTSWA